MRIFPKEPEFSHWTLILGSEIAKHLIEASRRARPKWAELFREYGDTVPELMIAARARRTYHHPLVRGFMVEWARKIAWGICPSGCRDAIGVDVPTIHIGRLKSSGGIEDFSILLGDTGSFTCASLGNNDHNREFGLIINCPAWLELGGRDDLQSLFERQLTRVIHHEMAHFRYQSSDDRAETHAHCRALASVLPSRNPPQSLEQFHALIASEYPEVNHNDEMQHLVLGGGQVTWRLVRRWLYRYQTTLRDAAGNPPGRVPK